VTKLNSLDCGTAVQEVGLGMGGATVQLQWEGRQGWCVAACSGRVGLVIRRGAVRRGVLHWE